MHISRGNPIHIYTDRRSRYNRQILYGCKNPNCETPTCLSRQKRVAQGPFRPYTVLSARTLATFLASQDHPERGLCPHQSIDVDSAKEVNPPGKKVENRRSLFAGSSSTHATSTANGIESTPSHERETKVHIANGRSKTLGLKPVTSRAGSFEKPKNNDHVRRDKDPTSFTQNIFDTVAMISLHRANPSDSHPPWAAADERAVSSDRDGNYTESKTDGTVSKTNEKDPEKPLIPETESISASNPPQIKLHSDISFVRSNTSSSDVVSTSGTVQRFTKVEENLDSFQHSGNDEKAHLIIKNEAKGSEPRAVTPISKISRSESQSKELDEAKMIPLQEIPVTAANYSETTSGFPTQSLSHFTMSNIIALREVRAACCSDLYEQHCLLKFLGRIDLPQHSSTCAPYGNFLAYSGQSMTYILSSVDALLQSFLHCDDNNAASRVVRSYDFALIVDLFRKLRRIDMHPHKIFPSLWISAGRLYPVSTATSKGRSLGASDLVSFPFNFAPTSQRCSLNDLEACHVVKIILAALVASVPKCSSMGWLAVRKLHASGQVAPLIDAENSAAEKKMIGKLVRTLHAFENETALNLVIRLARSIDIRYHLARTRALAEDADKNCRKFPPTFSRVVDYVNADSLKICVVGDEAQPSVKGGEWIDPEVEPITWHPREWPIIIEWLRAVILKEWDGKAKIAKGSAVGGALGLMLHICK